MRWFKAEEPSLEQSMELFKEINQALDTLNEAGLDATPGAVEDLLNAKGTPVEITTNENGSYTVRTVRKS